MNPARIDGLMQRLDRLERQVRRWKHIASAGIVILGLVVLLGAIGSQISDEVRAKRFVVVDGKGVEYAELGYIPSSGSVKPGAHLVFYTGEGGRVALRLGTVMGEESEPLFFISREKKAESVWLTAGGLDVRDPSNNASIMAIGLTVSKDGHGSGFPRGSYAASHLGFFDKDGKVIWKAP